MNRKITSLLAFIELAQQAERKSRRRMRRGVSGAGEEKEGGSIDSGNAPVASKKGSRKRMMKRRNCTNS